VYPMCRRVAGCDLTWACRQTLHQAGPEVKPRFFRRHGARDAQPQRAFQPVLPRRLLHQTHDRRRLDRVALLEGHRAALRAEIEAPDADRARGELQFCNPDEALRRRGQGAEAVVNLAGEVIQGLGALGGCDALVEAQAHVHIGDERLRQERRQAQLDFRCRGERLVEDRLAAFLQCLDRMLEQVEVHGEPDLGYLAALLLAEQLARAADLEVVGREHETGAELFHGLDGLEPLGRIARKGLARRRDEIGVGAVVRAADAPAQLMELSQPHVVGAIDDDGVGCRDVDAALDDGGAEKQVESAVVEVHHELLELALAHLPMADPDAGLWHQALHYRGYLLDGPDLVVHEVDLAAAAQLAQHGLAQGWPVPFDDEGLDRQPFRGRRRDQRQVT